jgi:hypothetical protein
VQHGHFARATPLIFSPLPSPARAQRAAKPLSVSWRTDGVFVDRYTWSAGCLWRKLAAPAKESGTSSIESLAPIGAPPAKLLAKRRQFTSFHGGASKRSQCKISRNLPSTANSAVRLKPRRKFVLSEQLHRHGAIA